MGPVDLSAIVHDLEIPVPPEVIVGIGTADDAGVYRIGPDLNLVLTADFITPPCDDPFLFGRIAAANSLSDVYAMGGTPRAVLNLCCFPTKGIPKPQLTEILKGGLETIKQAGAALVGGHTVRDDELKYGLSVTGLVRDSDIKTNAGARSGDLVILTKPVGTGAVVNGLAAKRLELSRAQPVLDRMAALNRSACEVMLAVGGAHGVTDITGFGLGGHAWEVASASGVGIRLYYSRVPRWDVGLEMLALGIHPGLLAANARSLEGRIQFDDAITEPQRQLFVDPQTSGGLFITVDPARADEMLRRLHDAGINDAAICGEVFAADTPGLDVRI
ncbi:MAG TPA: selenide, water dikinase SelD [bacterium]|nr:selenide, water dikinase SelD [bacterium]